MGSRREGVARALAAQPDHVTGRCYLGIAIYFQALAKWNRGEVDPARTQFADALAEFHTVIVHKPDQWQAHLFSGCSLRYLNRLMEATEACETAVRVMPQSADAHIALAEVLLDRKESSEAKSHLEEVVRLTPDNTRAQALLLKIRDKKDK